jgi:hypothetical protein
VTIRIFFRIKIVFIFFFTFLIHAEGQYVIKALPRWLVSTHATFLHPQDPVRKFLNGDDWGYHLEAQYRLQYNKPFLAGLYFSEAGLSRYVLKYTDADVRIREKANTRRIEGGLTAGFYPEINWVLQPYVQGRFGVAIFHSSSILTDRDSDELIERIPESSKIVSAYGLDFGIHIVPNIWYIRGDVRLGVVANPSVQFLSLNEALKGTVQYPIEAFDTHTSSGKWLKVSVGISYLF